MSQQSEDGSTRDLQLENQSLRRELKREENYATNATIALGLSFIVCATTTWLYSIEKNSPATPVDNDGNPYPHKVTLYTNDLALAATAQDVFYTHQKALKAPYIPGNISETQLLSADEDPSIALMVNGETIDYIKKQIAQVNLLSDQLLEPLEAELESQQIRYGQLFKTLDADQNNSSGPLACWMPPVRDTENPVFAIEAYVFKAIFGNKCRA